MGNNLRFDVRELAGRSCDCGKAHPVRTKQVLIGNGALAEAGNAARAAGLAGKALVVADPNTWAAAGEGTVRALESAGFAADVFVLPPRELHTDETTVGSILMALAADTSVLVAVGSGTINDSCRFVAKKTGLPYIVVGTAPSMDGYASDVSPVTRGGFKMTFPGVAPLAIIGDTAVLAAAPMNMLAAGFGDVFGKVTARLDWLMAHRLLGEYRCEQVAQVMARAVDACMTAAPGLAARDGAAVEGLMKGLVLAGLAMQMVGDSRPASGCEHHVAHFLEMRDMARGRHGTLHGDKVGMAELMMLRLYEKFFAADGLVTKPAVEDGARRVEMAQRMGAYGELMAAQGCRPAYAGDGKRLLDCLAADWAWWQSEVAGLPALRLAGERSIRMAGGPIRPAELGYDREDIVCAIQYAMLIRERFTILRMADMAGSLNTLAEELADEFC